MERKTGYYWVNDGGDWYIAKWNTNYNEWTLFGNEQEFKDCDFTEIDERRIERIN